MAEAHSAHDDHHHDHGEFIAHHFDGGAEQQFDSGKLGIWVFLVTEVLFFSGLFVAYTLYRNHHPEVFEQAHVFLDKYLGGLNTVVLLFSSLTMAMAVRAAQLGRNKNCGMYILITMVCAAMFLGVKAIEYSHKWDMGIFPGKAFDLSYAHPEPANFLGLSVSKYLIWISAIPAVLLIGFIVASVVGMLVKKTNFSKMMMGLAITVGGYFIGTLVGHFYMEATGDHMAESHVAAAVDSDSKNFQLVSMTVNKQEEEAKQEEAEQGDKKAEQGDKQAEGDKEAAEQGDEKAEQGDEKAEQGGPEGEHKEGEHKEGEHKEGAAGDHEHHDGHDHEQVFDKHHPDPESLSRNVPIFFSIYYCMTGLHAIHIIAGIAALGWVYWRCLLGHWRKDYFGPVDYVGLYWHLVDLIWIYLFPLLYLID